MRPPFFTRRELLFATAASCASPSMSFAAAPADRLATDFLVLGDWGRNGEDFQSHVARQMANQAAKRPIRFVVSTGDNFYNLGVNSVHDKKWITSFEEIYRDPELQQRWYPVLGNHDYGGNVYAQIDRTGKCNRWYMPQRWHMLSGSDFGDPDIDLFFIDTVVWKGRESFPYAFLGSSIAPADQAAQKKWLTHALLDSRAPLKLVFGHHPIFSVGKHGGKSGMADLDQLFRRAGVTAYVNGHDHCLYHITSPGMDYICSGGGSEELRAFTGDRNVFGCVLSTDCPGNMLPEDKPRWLSFVDRAGFASFTVQNQQVLFRLIDRSGVVFHEHTLVARQADESIRI